LPDKSTTAAPASPVRYAFKASLIGAAHQFELTEDGLAWRVAGRTGVWPYREISAVRLSYRPVSMQARRFRADISREGGGRLTILSTSWQTAALMAPQDRDYRAFILELHAQLARAGGRPALSGGLGQKTYAAAIALLLLIASILAGLLIRALVIGELAGALFLVGFAALFAWQVGGFVLRNRPLSYSFDRVPLALLP